MSDYVLEDQGEPSGLSSNQTAIYPDTASGELYKKKGSNAPFSIEFSPSAVLSVILTGISFAVSSPILATDTILVAFGKLQAQINNLNFSKVNSEYIIGTTSSPSTTSTTSGTATVIAEITYDFTPTDANEVLDLFFNSTFGESFTGKDETVHMGVYLDGTLQGDTQRSVSVKGTADSDKVNTMATQYSSTHTVAAHTLDVRFWIDGGIGATAVALNTRRNLIIKKTNE